MSLFKIWTDSNISFILCALCALDVSAQGGEAADGMEFLQLGGVLNSTHSNYRLAQRPYQDMDPEENVYGSMALILLVDPEDPFDSLIGP